MPSLSISIPTECGGKLVREGQLLSRQRVSSNPCPFPPPLPRQEPERHPFFVINNPKPFNAEPPPELLLDAGFITPNELYYVRNHLPVPTVDPEKYRLHVEVEGKVGRCVQYSLEDLKTKFPQVAHTACRIAHPPPVTPWDQICQETTGQGKTFSGQSRVSNRSSCTKT